MSRRFGRNQKRRMREALTAAAYRLDQLEEARAMDRGLLRHQSENISDLKDFIEEVACIVGDRAVAAGKPTFMRFKYAGDRIQLEPSPGMHPALPSSFSPQCDRFRVETLRLLEVSAVRDAVAGQLHIHAELADRVVRYGLSEAAIRGLPYPVLLHRIATEMAKQLLVEFEKAGIRPPSSSSFNKEQNT